MRLPPALVHMKVREEGRTKIRLWLPLFILWPILLVVLVLVAIGALLADVVTLFMGRRPGYTRLLAGCLEVLGESKGVQVSVEGEDHTVAFTLK